MITKPNKINVQDNLNNKKKEEKNEFKQKDHLYNI